MTKIEELEQKLNELENLVNLSLKSGITPCKKALAELKESKKEGKWKPKDGEVYWYRNSFGQICYETEGNEEWQTKNIPIFKNCETCKRYWHFMDTVKEKSYEFSKEELVDISITKWCIVSKRNNIEVDYVYDAGLLGGIYFKKPQDAKYIIDNFKEELLEYWI